GGGRWSDDKISARRDDGIRWKSEVDSAGQPVAADVFRCDVAVVDLDEFQIPTVGAVGWVIHDLIEDQAGGARSRSAGFGAGTEIIDVRRGEVERKRPLCVCRNGVRA